jgi:virginiamycin B lyase
MGGSPAIGRITIEGTITTFTDARLVQPSEITTAPDGALWFTDASGQIGRVTTSGSFSFFSDSRIQNPKGIVTGPDGAVWFTNSGTYDDQGNLTGSSIGRITTSGRLKFYSDTSIVSPNGITAGPDGALWFTNSGSIGRITTAGKVSSYAAIGTNPWPSQITTGPDGAMWFTQQNNVVGRMDTAVTPDITSFTPATAAVGTKVTITGVNLGHASRVAFSGTTAAIVSNSSTKIVVRVPVGAVTGPITVTTPIGTATSPGTFAVA